MENIVKKEYEKINGNKLSLGNDFSHIKTGKDFRNALIRYAIYFGLVFEILYADEVIAASKNIFNSSYSSLKKQIENVRIFSPDDIYK